MTTLEKIAILNTEAEAMLLDSVLTEREIPHLIKSYLDSALDGIFQTSMGWGHVEAPIAQRDEIIAIIDDIRGETDASE